MMDIRAYIYNEKLKGIKVNVGSKCRHLANRKSVEGDRSVEVGVVTSDGYKKFEFTMPTLISDITDADYSRLEDLIRSKM